MRSILLYFWNIIDPIYYLFTRLTYINKKKGNIFRVRKTTYLGYDVNLSDGTKISHRDLLIKIHLHNVRLVRDMRKIKSDFKKGTYIYRAIKQSLPDLAKYIYEHPEQYKIKGIIGITTLHRGCEKLGFEPKPLKNKLYRKMKWTSFIPISYISSVDMNLKDLIYHEPKYLFMSKNKLFELYLHERDSVDTNQVSERFDANLLIGQKVLE